MGKLFYTVRGRFRESLPYKNITIDCNKIIFFEEYGEKTRVFFSDYHIEVEMSFGEFQKNVISQVFNLELQEDILQLMAGYLSNNATGNVLIETLIKDCKGIIKTIASENNSL
jgi:hypothetical protein